MKNYLLSVLLIVFTFISGSAYAQTTIKGTVTDSANGEAIPGVNVVIVELQRGASSNAFGEYELRDIPEGTYTLTATLIGYKTFESQLVVSGAQQVFNVALEQDILRLDDVVVTAFGIEREERALGYGVSSVGSEDIQNRNDVEISRALTGQLPGVSVQATGGVTGSGTEIVIRGFTTLTGSNDPLIIVDGVQFEGSANTTSDFIDGGGLTTTPSRLLDIDPKNIEDVTVLKGLSATVLYGEKGRNGVILVTTKSGSFSKTGGQGFQITLDQSVYATQVSSRPTYQDTYGNGFDQNFGWFFSNWGPKFDTNDPTLFGSNFRGFDNDGTVLISHPLWNFAGNRAAFPEFEDAVYRYEAYPDPIEAFFQTGLASNTNLNISGGFEDLRLNVSYSRNAEEGFTPNNTLERNAFSIGANYKISDKFTAQTTFNMSLTDMETPPLAAGYGSGTYGTTSVFGDLMYTPRSIDLSIPYENPINGANAYYRSNGGIPHPFWTVNNAKTTNYTQRFYGKTEFQYEVNENVNLVYRLGYDTFGESQDYLQNRGAGSGVPSYLDNGFYQTIDVQSENWDTNINAIFRFQPVETISIDGTIGAQYVSQRRERQGLESTDMIINGFFKHTNFTSQNAVNSFTGASFQQLIERNTAGVFSEVTIGYDDVVYLNLAGRNDWFSTLEKDNRSIFYPSANLSVILSDLFDITNKTLSYLKVYVGVGSSAGSPSPYSTRNVLASNARAFITGGSVVTTNATSSFLGNPNLKPELHSEYEVGSDIRLYNGRLALNASAYTKSVTNLITSSPLDPSTGFTSTLVNIGNIENRGLELTLRATPMNGPLKWNISANYVATRSEVKELSDQLDRIAVGGFTDQGNYAIVGEPFLVMYGYKILRVTEELKDNDTRFADAAVGTPIVDTQGNYIEAPDLGIIGDPTPDWNLSLSNSFRYKGATLSFQIDYQQGGDMFSTWISSLMARGLTKDTDVVDRNNTFILPNAVKQDGTPNDIQISPSDVFFNNFGFGPAELNVYDMTHIRLSNVSLAYSIPVDMVSKTPFKNITITLSGDNLFMKAFNVPKYSGFDPNVNSVGGNSRGFEYFTGPAARRFGGSIRVTI